MMLAWMIGFWLATVLPMAALLVWVAPAVVVRWRRARPVSRAGLLLFWGLGACFLLARPHDDSFTGLDNMTYRHLSYAFLEGRGFHDPDKVLAEVPEALREDFLLHRGPVGRPTRDRVFKLSGWQAVDTQPFFMPTLSLAAAAQDAVLAPERFVPLIATLWLALVLAAGFCAGGGWGLVAVVALVLGTAWPAWFLRGFYAEGVGALLVSGVVAASSVRSLRGAMAAVAGLALGMAVSYHPTMVILSGPVALALWLERRELKTVLGLASGLVAGWLPFWALTRWVCQPYGDWTRWAKLKELVVLAPEHEAVALVLVLLALGSAVALWAGFYPAVRSRIRRWDAWLNPWGWLAAGLIPLALIAVLPGWAGEALRRGASSTWSGIRWPYAALVLAGMGLVLAKKRPIRERFWLVTLCWCALFFLFIKGVETPVGLWSQRRFLPIVVVGIGWLSAPLAAGLAGISGKSRKSLAVMLVALASGANLVRWPVAYVAINEQGAAKWIGDISARIGPERWVVFDYYGHSVPYAASLKQHVLGLGEPSRSHWPEVAGWIASLASNQEVWVATSWQPCTLERGFRFEEVFAATGDFPVVRAKAFFPAEQGLRVVENHFMRVVPLVPGETVAQDKQLNESPIGLRGLWGNAKDSGSGQMARWTRPGSGIVGPVPAPGRRVRVELECAFMKITPDWTNQTVQIVPPWGGEPAQVEVGAGWQTITVSMVRPLENSKPMDTGTYVFRVGKPYDPETQGLRGYPNDLGIQIRRIIIRIESEHPSVPD